MRTKTYIAISSAINFTFLELPVGEEVKPPIHLPGSEVYSYIELPMFICQLIEKFPGNIQDLAEAVGAKPQFIAIYGPRYYKTTEPRVSFSAIMSYESTVKLIKLWYKHVVATNPNVIES